MSIELSKQSINELADAIVYRQKDFNKMESEKILRDTKMLLKNYRLLESHLEVETPQIKDDTPLSRYEQSLLSLLGYRVRSEKMITFVTNIFSQYKGILENGTVEERRRFDVINSLYIANQRLTKNKLCEKYHVDLKTIQRDERKAINELSVMIFGIDGINDMSK